MHSAERVRRLIQFSRRANFGRKKRLRRLAKKAFSPGVIKSTLGSAGVAGVLGYLDAKRRGYDHGYAMRSAARQAALGGAVIGSVLAGGSAAGVVNPDIRGGVYRSKRKYIGHRALKGRGVRIR
ncbi:hypothetical protein [Allocoleopsis sp.]|uniref:hypothetical protein n=1 Tax=Allocoleopsis sp. TaxID=3088169 RepID=UPI002FCFDB7B